MATFLPTKIPPIKKIRYTKYSLSITDLSSEIYHFILKLTYLFGNSNLHVGTRCIYFPSSFVSINKKRLNPLKSVEFL